MRKSSAYQGTQLGADKPGKQGNLQKNVFVAQDLGHHKFRSVFNSWRLIPHDTGFSSSGSGSFLFAEHHKLTERELCLKAITAGYLGDSETLARSARYVAMSHLTAAGRMITRTTLPVASNW